MFLLNSRLGLFSAAASLQHPFSRSYGVILPSSLTSVLPFVLGFSPCLPVSVCGTGTYDLASSFSRQCEIICFVTDISLHITPWPYDAYFTTPQPRRLYRDDHYPARLSFCVTASLKRSSVVQEYQPAVHRLRRSVLGLGPDLPWADEPSPGNLRLSTGMFLACLALLIPAFSLLYRPQLLSVLLLPIQNAPLPIT